jgi:3-hydroxybutyryl-CoA dehydrogenase
MEFRAAAVIGLGTMGAGIAEVLARGGLPVIAVEADDAALARGMAILEASLAVAVARGKLTAAQQAEILGRVRPAASIGEAAAADLVIEAVPERLDAKLAVFGELDRACRPDAILATNTSSLSVTAIAARTAHPGRVVGLHFFNPAPVMRLVEVITTVLTGRGTGDGVTGLVQRLGKTPVAVTDRAGFVANALLLPYLNHAVTLLETGYATREDIDTAARAGIGLPMGPLALLDLIGLDVSLSIMEVLRGEFGGPRYRPAPLLRRLADAGLTGRKGGRGFYGYPAGQRQPSASPAVGSDAAAGADHVAVTLICDEAAGTAELAGLIEAAGGRVTVRSAGAVAGQAIGGAGGAEAGSGGAARAGSAGAGGAGVGGAEWGSAEAGGLVIVAAGDTGAGVLPAAIAAGRPADAVGLHLGTGNLAELVTTPLSCPAAIDAARTLAAGLGREVVRCPDRPGFLAGALLYPHLGDAVRMVQDGYATAADIDAAMTLGCGYPRGPLRMLDDIGPARVLAGLRAMHARYGDPAFAPAPLLAEYVAAGISFCP